MQNIAGNGNSSLLSSNDNRSFWEWDDGKINKINVKNNTFRPFANNEPGDQSCIDQQQAKSC